jgi:hypothetical protein
MNRFREPVFVYPGAGTWIDEKLSISSVASAVSLWVNNGLETRCQKTSLFKSITDRRTWRLKASEGRPPCPVLVRPRVCKHPKVSL